jgi:hypothetical protein
VEPVPIWRVMFWTFYVLGVLALVFGLLLSYVPRRIDDKDFRLEETIWFSCLCLQVATLLLAGRIFRVRSEHSDLPVIYGVFSGLALAQLLFCLYRLIGVILSVQCATQMQYPGATGIGT